MDPVKSFRYIVKNTFLRSLHETVDELLVEGDWVHYDKLTGNNELKGKFYDLFKWKLNEYYTNRLNAVKDEGIRENLRPRVESALTQIESTVKEIIYKEEVDDVALTDEAFTIINKVFI